MEVESPIRDQLRLGWLQVLLRTRLQLVPGGSSRPRDGHRMGESWASISLAKALRRSGQSEAAGAFCKVRWASVPSFNHPRQRNRTDVRSPSRRVRAHTDLISSRRCIHRSCAGKSRSCLCTVSDLRILAKMCSKLPAHAAATRERETALSGVPLNGNEVKVQTALFRR